MAAVIIKIRFKINSQLLIIIIQIQKAVACRRNDIRNIIILALFFFRHGIGGNDEKRIQPLFLQTGKQLPQHLLLILRYGLPLRYPGKIRNLTGTHIIPDDSALQRIRPLIPEGNDLAGQHHGFPVGMILENIKVIGITRFRAVRIHQRINRLNPVPGVFHIIGHSPGIGHILGQPLIRPQVHAQFKNVKPRILRFLRLLHQMHRRLGPLHV